MADSFMPPEKVQKIGANKHKFDGFDDDIEVTKENKWMFLTSWN